MKWFLTAFLVLFLFGSCSNSTDNEEEQEYLWRTAIPPDAWNSTPPIIYNDLVVVQLVDSLRAYDKNSGSLEWCLKLNDRFVVTFTVPQYDHYAFYCGREEVYKIDLETGSIVWEFTTESATDLRHLMIDAEFLYFGTSGGKYYQLNRETGEPVSSYEVVGENIKSATPYEGRVFLCSYNRHTYSGHLTCLSEGELLWSNETGGILSKPAFYEDKVIVSEHPNTTVVYDRETGIEIHRYEDYSHPNLSPLVEDSCLYLSAPYTVTKIDLESHQIIWDNSYGARYDLVPDTDQLFVVWAARIRCYSKETGEMNFEYRPENDEAISQPCYEDGIVYFIGGAYVYAYEP